MNLDTTWETINTTEIYPTEVTSDYVNATLSQDVHVISDDKSGPLVWSAVNILALGFLGLLFVFSVIGNSLVVYVIGHHLGYNTVTNVFISALSVCHLLTTLMCMPMSFITMVTGRWLMQQEGCVFNGLLFSGLEAVSMIMMMLITIDRYIVVVKISPKAYTKRTACLAILFTVFMAFFFSFPWYVTNRAGLLIRWRALGVMTTDTVYKVGYPHCMYMFHGMTSHNGSLYTLLYTTLWYILPFGCMLYCVVCLLKIIRNCDNQIRPTTTHFNELRFSGEIRTSKTVLFMNLFCFLCKGPYFISGLVLFSNQNTRPLPAADVIMTLLTWCTCIINPLLYATRNPVFWQILRRRNSTWYIPNEPPPDVVISSRTGHVDAENNQSASRGELSHFQTGAFTVSVLSPDVLLRSVDPFNNLFNKQSEKYRVTPEIVQGHRYVQGQELQSVQGQELQIDPDRELHAGRNYPASIEARDHMSQSRVRVSSITAISTV